MPVVYRCRNCGAILYMFATTEKIRRGRGRHSYYTHRVEAKGASKWLGMLTPSEVAERLGGKCPVCGAELKPTDPRIRISERRWLGGEADNG